jgi:RNA polymerase sigma-70 factor (ECF subfamily)
MKRLAEISYEESEFLFEDPDLDPAEIFEQVENREIYRQKLAKLRPIYAEVLTLKYSFEYSDQEMAELLGITGETARTRLRRARNQLRVEFDEEGDD